MKVFLLASIIVAAAAAPLSVDSEPAVHVPVAYSAKGQLKFPSDYREWMFLSSGIGMVYGPMANTETGPPKFDNVFVNPDAYRAFLRTGHWPDKTIFVLEVRASQSHGSINTDGHFQTSLVGIEAEVKDTTAKTGEWTFYGFGIPKSPLTAQSAAIPRNASCYSCHAANTAVENTFVQFYPSLFEVAKSKGTLNPKFVTDSHSHE